ncbi:MAG: alpha/beta hydrolase, partial [Anaerolineales bacterium]
MIGHDFPPPGEFIEVNGRKVHIQRIGTGFPTVIFESGLFADSYAFYQVQSKISEITSTLSYDRAGMGYSDSSPNPPRRASVFAEELFDLLQALKIAGPIIFVGWSAGGIYGREFARQHPEMVSGMVFIDSAHENLRSRQQADPVLTEWLKEPFDQIRMFTKFSKMTREEVLNEIESFQFPDYYTDHQLKYYKDISRPERFAYYLTLASFFEKDATQGENMLSSLGNMPLVVITKIATKMPTQSEEIN